MQEAPRTPLTDSASSHQAHRPAGTQRRWVYVVALLILIADQVTKAWALRQLAPGERVDLVGDLLGLSLVHNPGAAFSLGDRATAVMTLIAVAITAMVLFATRKVGSVPWALSLGALLGGAVGNLVDRMVRPPGVGRGTVVDFIDYAGFFVGNVADIAIVGAAVVIAWLLLREIPIDGRTHG